MENDARTADAVTTPEDASYRHEMGQLLERHIDSLPESLRVVFVMREVEELTTAETATLLAISQEAVRVRLHRARSLLQEQIASVLAWAPEAFHFGGERCNRMVRSVFRELGIEEPGSGAPAQEASGRSLR
jgi:RNA polymerase sigma-70 factor (ECF subfamily)